MPISALHLHMACRPGWAGPGGSSRGLRGCARCRRCAGLGAVMVRDARIDAEAIVYNNVYMAATVRIEPSAHEALAAIARAKQLSLTEALSRAIEVYRREVFVADLALDFAALREEPGAWAEEVAQRAEWDGTAGDGLQPEGGKPRPASAVARQRSKRRFVPKNTAPKNTAPKAAVTKRRR